MQCTFNTKIFIVFHLELTINQTKIDETGIRFPDISTNNVSGSSEQIPTFLELPKQDTKSEKGMDWIYHLFTIALGWFTVWLKSNPRSAQFLIVATLESKDTPLEVTFWWTLFWPIKSSVPIFSYVFRKLCEYNLLIPLGRLFSTNATFLDRWHPQIWERVPTLRHTTLFLNVVQKYRF